MRPGCWGILLAGLVMVGVAQPTRSATTVGNAQELLELLVQGQKPVALIVLQPERGCGPAGCSIDVKDLSIRQDVGGLKQVGGKAIKLQAHAVRTSVALPDIDWDPLGAYTLTTHGDDEGMCLEFTHEGLGKSGSFQRWGTVVFVPRRGGKLGPVAHRFVGYWASCSVLAGGRKPGEFVLPMVEPVDAAGRLGLVWYRCEGSRCEPTVDRRSVVRVPGSETGALVISGKP